MSTSLNCSCVLKALAIVPSPASVDDTKRVPLAFTAHPPRAADHAVKTSERASSTVTVLPSSSVSPSWMLSIPLSSILTHRLPANVATFVPPCVSRNVSGLSGATESVRSGLTNFWA